MSVSNTYEDLLSEVGIRITAVRLLVLRVIREKMHSGAFSLYRMCCMKYPQHTTHQYSALLHSLPKRDSCILLTMVQACRNSAETMQRQCLKDTISRKKETRLYYFL